MAQLVVTESYLIDLINFLNVLTGDEFYVSRHPEAYERWAPRLSAESREALAAAVAAESSSMLSPGLLYALSCVPGFEAMDPVALLADSSLIESHLATGSDYAPGHWEPQIAQGRRLAPVAAELARLGYQEYWLTERLPLIQAAKASLESFLEGLQLEIGAAVGEMLGVERREQMQLFLCSFAAPHGIKIIGPRFISDIRFSHQTTVRIAIHEMFHPPYVHDAVAAEAAALIADPLFQDSFRTKDPRFGYETEDGFLEENVVEAMELHVSSQAGLMADPVGYLLEHDGGSHWLSVVLVHFFKKVPKAPSERFGDYFRRLVPRMPVGGLKGVYEAQLARRAATVASRSLELRPATLADAETVHQITKTAFAPYIGVLHPTPPAALEELPAVEADCQTGRVLIALWDGQAVGAARWEPRDGLAYLRRVAVHPDFQGRGIARALIAALEAEGRQAGFTKAKIETRYILRGNWLLYMRCGYQVTRLVPRAGGDDSTIGLTKDL